MAGLRIFFAIISLLTVVTGLIWLVMSGIGMSSAKVVADYSGKILYDTFVVNLVFAFLLILAGLLGCWAAFKENKRAISLFAIVVAILLALNITGAIQLNSKRDLILSKASVRASNGIRQIFNSTDHSKADAIQEKLNCCGYESSDTEWTFRDLPPKSCCDKEDDRCWIDFPGCLDKVGDLITVDLKHKIQGTVIFRLAFVSIVQIVALISSLILRRCLKPSFSYQLDHMA